MQLTCFGHRSAADCSDLHISVDKPKEVSTARWKQSPICKGEVTLEQDSGVKKLSYYSTNLIHGNLKRCPPECHDVKFHLQNVLLNYDSLHPVRSWPVYNNGFPYPQNIKFLGSGLRTITLMYTSPNF